MFKTFKIKYDINKYQFRQTVEHMLDEKDLEHVHKFKQYTLFERETDQSTIWHKLYYAQFTNGFNNLYKHFIKEEIKPIFALEDRIIYQKIPTFRAHLVDNLGVGAWHKDKDYNHGVTEINLWMPFTNAYDTNTIWIESEEDKGDYIPWEVNYGEVLVFDGANLTHGNKVNTTDTSRLSVDFRIVDPESFNPSDKGSVNTNSKFKTGEGGYFDIM